MYSLKFTDAAKADIQALPKHVKNTLKKLLEQKVAWDPLGCSKDLQRELDGYRSFAFGGYRMVFKVFEDLRAVAVAGWGMRDASSKSNIHRKLEQLANTGKLAQGVLCTLRELRR